LKALGVPEGLRWHELEVVNDGGGAPSFRLSGNAAAAAAARGVRTLHLSITHADDSAVAFVVAEG
jgi:holo-[acyl-carrier protein] synthase